MNKKHLSKVVDFQKRLCRSGVSPDIERLEPAGLRLGAYASESETPNTGRIEPRKKGAWPSRPCGDWRSFFTTNPWESRSHVSHTGGTPVPLSLLKNQKECFGFRYSQNHSPLSLFRPFLRQ